MEKNEPVKSERETDSAPLPARESAARADSSEPQESNSSQAPRATVSRSRTVTLILVGIACVLVYLLYSRFVAAPWTRDAQVRAKLVQITPRVSGYLTGVLIADNQFVRAGELLFQIDKVPYQLAVDRAKVQLAQAREQVEAMEAEVRAAEAVIVQRQAGVETAKNRVEEARSAIETAVAGVVEAKASITHAQAVVRETETRLLEARREADRASRLADQNAGSVEESEAKQANAAAIASQLTSAKSGEVQANAALDQAQANENESRLRLITAKSTLAEAEAAVLTATANRDKAVASLGETGERNVMVRTAKNALDRAELDLSWTSIYAPTDGFITNMNLDPDTLVAQGQPFALFVDSSSFRVDAYFQETKLRRIKPGHKVTVTIMGHSQHQLEGQVESIGYAINPPRIAATDGAANLVPTIAPTFEWIRLAQRVPVRIQLTNVPSNLHLASGMTASVAVHE